MHITQRLNTKPTCLLLQLLQTERKYWHNYTLYTVQAMQRGKWMDANEARRHPRELKMSRSPN